MIVSEIGSSWKVPLYCLGALEQGVLKLLACDKVAEKCGILHSKAEHETPSISYLHRRACDRPSDAWEQAANHYLPYEVNTYCFHSSHASLYIQASASLPTSRMHVETSGPSMPLDVSFLPQELFLMILSYLEPPDVVRCRRVCKLWFNTFTNPSSLIPLLKKWYPLAREVRELREKGMLDDRDINSKDCHYWYRIFDRVISRYDHLARGKPRSIRKLKLCQDSPVDSSRWFQPPPWDSHKSHFFGRVEPEFKFNQVFWTYEDGLLVYPSEEHRSLLLMDLDTDSTYVVPFSIGNKVIRRIRLQDKLLVIEWAHHNVFHWLDDDGGLHYHFASSFDIQPAEGGWNVTFRNEWQIMLLGHSLSKKDRFFSSHNNTHYVIYAWQPIRSPYTADEDAPIESLFVWDISNPSSYRPSLDPTGHLKDDEASQGPMIVSRLSFKDLAFYSVLQRGCPRIVKLDVNSEAGTVDITENVWTGPRNLHINPAEYTSEVQIISIPFRGYGPCWRRDAGMAFPPYRGNSSMQPIPVSSGIPWYTMVSEAFDPLAQVNFYIQLQSHTYFRRFIAMIRTPHIYKIIDDWEAFQISSKGSICGNERHFIGENFDRELVIFYFDK